MFRSSLNILTFVLCLSTAFPAIASGKYALLVGVTRYDHASMSQSSPLEYPEQDAKAIGDLLESGGYEVELLLGKDATLAEVLSKLEALKQKGDPDGVILVGMFGYGGVVKSIASDGTMVVDAVFCPFDAVMRSVVDSNGNSVKGKNQQTLIEPDPATVIKLSEFMKAMKLAKAENRIVLADCCRDVSKTAREWSFSKAVNDLELPKRTALLLGCSPNEQTYEHDDWGHGAFTSCLLDTIRELSAEGNKLNTAQLARQMKKCVPFLVASVSPQDKQTPRLLFTSVVDVQFEPSQIQPKTITNTIGMTLTLIPSGAFLMGAPLNEKGRTQGERLPKRVMIPQSFYMGVYEVTQEEYQKLTKRNPSCFSSNGSSSKQVVGLDTSRFPVEHVSWYDAVEYCNLLSEIDRRPPYYIIAGIERRDDGSIKSATVATVDGTVDEQGSGYRLPTEAEWEYACRAGTATAFWFGSTNTGKYANVNGTLLWRTTAVGQFAKNKFGLYDTVGNTWEWCEDEFDTNDTPVEQVRVDRQALGTSSVLRANRGGSWIDVERYTRSAFRNGYSPDSRGCYGGFRVACGARTP